MKNKVIMPFRSAKHQHRKCQKIALDSAKKLCESQGQRLTPLRQRVLELVWQTHEPVKAYDILDQLKDEHSSSAPPTVYRALDFLQEQGLVHKIESLNAYIGCGGPDESHEHSQFLICQQCGAVAELDDIDITNLLNEKVSELGFTMQTGMVEIVGVCAICNH